ncbi:MAG TPA: hypothetical protein VII53_06890, partial [Solirubrobacteraceae bacterium]
MNARWLILALLLAACTSTGALALGAGSAAAATEFGEEGVHSGQFKSPYGVAVNQATGDVYVADQRNWRVDRFDGSGNWLMAWGWGVNEESPAAELQTCTTRCQAGKPGTGAGTYNGEGPHGVAVDNNEPLVNPSYGDVYVADWGNYRVEKFGPEGEFISMFGGGVITGGASGTGDLTSGSETITSVTTTSKAFLEGQTVTGAGIPPATKITAVGNPKSNDAGTITLSQPATASGTGVALTVAEGAGNVPTNEQQTVTISGTPTAGTFTLTFTAPDPSPTEETTAAIAYNAEPSGPGSVQEALENLPNIGVGNVAVSGAAGGPYTVEFKGRYADTNVAKMSDESFLEGGEIEEFGIATTVEGHSAPEVCSTASICQAGAPGTSDGQFQWAFDGSYIAVGPKGNVYVGDEARVQVFEPSGAWKENISLAGLSSFGQVTALAVDPAGDMFVKDGKNLIPSPHYEAGAMPGVREFAPNGTEMLTVFDEGSESVAALAVDKSGDLYVGDENGGFHVLKYDPAGNELASFGLNTVEFALGMAFADTAGQLYVTDAGQASNDVKVLTPPPPGPLIEPGSDSATPSRHGEATLEATVDPEGHETTYHFEYLTEEQFKADGETFGAGTVATAESAPITGTLVELFEDHLAQVKLPEATLAPGVTYHWRVVATDSLGHITTGADESFEETPSALIDGPWATEVTSTSATLAARIDPQGASTSYRLEYGTSVPYEHVLAGNVGAGSAFIPISYPIQELTASTTYHYRLLTNNECIVGRTCTREGADHTFTTQPAGASQLALPDGRAWELVTPASTGGTVLELSSRGTQAASDGSAIAYLVSGAPLGENAVSNAEYFNGNQILSLRGANSWRTQDIDQSQGPPGEGESAVQLTLGGGGSYALFSSDLASAAAYPPLFSSSSHSSEALAGTPYLRDNADGSYAPLLTPANTPPGTQLLGPEPPFHAKKSQVYVLAGTPDLGHVILGSPLKLTKEAIPTGKPIANGAGIGNLYEWSSGRLQLVNVLPDGTPLCSEGTPPCDATSALPAGTAGGLGSTQRTVSSDGRRVAWTRGDPYGAEELNYKGLYLRDMVEGKTVQLGGLGARYQTMNSDGSRVFFLEKGDLYEYDASTGAQTDLTANHPGEASAGVQESVSDVSEDGSYVYFVANGVLGDGAEHGAKSGECAPSSGSSQQTCNLYLLHNNGSAWEEPKFIATLSSEDKNSWYSQHAGPPDLTRVTSRVSPGGRYLTFMSNRSLTGYDNVDANPSAYEMKQGAEGKLEVVVDKEGNPVRARAEEVYLYDSLAGRLVCASCDPGGVRPAGVSTERELLVTRPGGAWAEVGQPHWLAGSLPGWQVDGGVDTVYQPRYLSDSGRLFFDSPEALVPKDTNGLEDVYQYEPPGVGGCASTSATFSVRSGGCVDLVSSGTSKAESAFMDASGKGPGGEAAEDVFFLASNRLTAADTDTGFDVWDAHVCSAAAPCATLPVSPP